MRPAVPDEESRSDPGFGGWGRDARRSLLREGEYHVRNRQRARPRRPGGVRLDGELHGPRPGPRRAIRDREPRRRADRGPGAARAGGDRTLLAPPDAPMVCDVALRLNVQPLSWRNRDRRPATAIVAAPRRPGVGSEREIDSTSAIPELPRRPP